MVLYEKCIYPSCVGKPIKNTHFPSFHFSSTAWSWVHLIKSINSTFSCVIMLKYFLVTHLRQLCYPNLLWTNDRQHFSVSLCRNIKRSVRQKKTWCLQQPCLLLQASIENFPLVLLIVPKTIKLKGGWKIEVAISTDMNQFSMVMSLFNHTEVGWGPLQGNPLNSLLRSMFLWQDKGLMSSYTWWLHHRSW